MTKLTTTRFTIFRCLMRQRFYKVFLAVGGVISLSGCLLTSPYHNQEFTSHTNAIPLQAWTTDKDKSVTFECSQASHGGLYPYWGPTWTHVTSIMPDQPGVLDSAGARIYSAAKLQTLPASCWRQDPANNVWYSAIRVVQDGDEFNTFNAAGLECLGKENGKAKSWFGWIGKSCHRTYTNTGNSIPYVIFYSKS